MTFVSSAALLDAIVLAVVSREKDGAYGYRITQQVKDVLDVSESALYPVLRRLQKGRLPDRPRRHLQRPQPPLLSDNGQRACPTRQLPRRLDGLQGKDRPNLLRGNHNDKV